MGSAPTAEQSKAITGYYKEYLGRSPQPSEIRDWVGTGKSLAEIESGLSGHALSTYGRQQITNFYQDSLKRAPQDSEIRDWQGTGKSLDQIKAGIAGFAANNPGMVGRASAPAADPNADYEARLKEREGEWQQRESQYKDLIGQWRSKAEAAESEYQNRFTSAIGTYQSALEQSRKEASEAREAASLDRADAEAFRQREVDSQLSSLRSGSTVGGNNPGFPSGRSTASGGIAYRSSGREGVVRVDIDADDSVLDRGQPVGVVSQASRPRAASADRGVASSRASSYYRKRFS
jgi:uncharacterized protein YukE